MEQLNYPFHFLKVANCDQPNLKKELSVSRESGGYARANVKIRDLDKGSEKVTDTLLVNLKGTRRTYGDGITIAKPRFGEKGCFSISKMDLGEERVLMSGFMNEHGDVISLSSFDSDFVKRVHERNGKGPAYSSKGVVRIMNKVSKFFENDMKYLIKAMR